MNPPMFLPDAPPPWFARAMATLALGACGLGVWAAVAVPLPEVQEASFVLRAEDQEAAQVQAAVAGQVASRAARRAERVQAGEVVATLRSDVWGRRTEEAHTARVQLAAARAGLTRARTEQDARARAADATQAGHARRTVGDAGHLVVLQQELAAAREEAADARSLWRRGAVSEGDVARADREVTRVDAALRAARAERAGSAADRTRLAAEAQLARTRRRRPCRRGKSGSRRWRSACDI